VASSDPVVLLATGMSVPDDLLYVADDGSVLVGEHGDGHIVRVVAPGKVQRLPQVVPEAEGIAIAGGTTYIADQFNARVVALTSTGVRTVLQLQPVSSGENLDGISATTDGTGLVVPDSPHGTVLFVDLNGHVTGRVGGFSRPAGVAPDPQAGGYLIADENAGAVFEILGGKATRLVGGLPGADDAVRDAGAHVLVILPGAGRLVDATTGRNVATGLRNPQGLGFDGAQNVLVTESDAGRLDLVVTTFVAEVPAGTVQLTPGQGICFDLLRAPGNTEEVKVHQATGALAVTDPLTGSQGEVVPPSCPQDSCSMTIELQGPSGTEFAQLSYRD
jgi:DNA-binding beta-propeller fold protein YncE